MSKQDYLILSEHHNAMDNLIQSLTFLAQIEQNLFYIKWFIIAFHSTLYSFMLLVLQGRNQSLIYQAEPGYKNTKSEPGFSPFDGKLISFTSAYESIKNKLIMTNHIFEPTAHDSCITELNNKMRNQMIHFKPMVWGAQSWYPAQVCRPLLDILRFCIKDEYLRLSATDNKTALAYVDSIEKLLIKHEG